MLTVYPILEGFAAEVIGVNLASDMEHEEIRALKSALDEYAVLVLPGQALEEEQQVKFAAHFGPLETSVSAAVYQVGEKRRLQKPQLSDISNLDEKGQVLEQFDLRRLINISNQLWHTDSSFRSPAASISILSAQEIAPVGGMTEFADMRAAWDALSEKTKEILRPLSAEHDYFHSRGLTGFDTSVVPSEWREAAPAVTHPLIRKHPNSGRESVYLASHIKRILGLDQQSSDELFDELMTTCTQAQFVYRHRWRTDDVVIWDNRCTMHRGRPFPAEYRRAMRRATVAETSPAI